MSFFALSVELHFDSVIMKTMKNKYALAIIGIFLFWLSGCARVTETTKEVAKVIWGSSTKALEEVRPEALKKVYQCPWGECFEKVLSIAEKEKMKVFIADRKNERIVLMGIPKSIETTEVGVFFTSLESDKTTVEITSLSPEAKESAANIIFLHLSRDFKEIP